MAVVERERSPSPRARLEQQLDATLRVSRALLETDLWGVAATVTRVAVELLDAQQGSVGLFDAETGDVFTAASLELPRPEARTRFARGEGVAGWVAATGRPALIQDVRKDPRYLRLRYPAVRSFLSVPMQADGQLVGVLSCGAWEPFAFGEPEMKTLLHFAEHAAVALKIAQELHLHRESAERAKDFLLDAAHELKAPLHSISGMLDLVLRDRPGRLDAEQRDLLATARQECARLGDSIAALLEMSVAQHRPVLATQPSDVSALVAEVIERQRPAAQVRRVSLRQDTPDDLPVLEIDAAAIQQVLVNLVSNAIKASPPNTDVVVSAEVQGDEVCFSVTDAGPGVPLEQREHIFERFYQADPGRRAPGEIGLGLALCRDIVERHGGRIWVSSGDEAGARLSFTLPVGEAPGAGPDKR